MDSPLRLLRDLLPQSQPPADQVLANKARVLLDTMAGHPAAEVVVRLGSEVIPAILRQGNLHMRFKLLEDARQEAEGALPTLEEQVERAALPLPMEATTAALHADNLIKALAMAYCGIARHLSNSQQSIVLSHLFHRSILRAMSMLARRQQLAYRAYATPSAASWQLLHELYQLACSPNAKPLNGDTAPIEHQYLGALLLAYLEPNKLPRNELNTVIECIRQLAAYAVIAEISAAPGAGRSSESCFVVRPGEGSPGCPLLRLPAGATLLGGLIIDCSPVLAALDRNLGRLPGKAVQPDLDAAPALLQTLRVALGGKSARRFSRTRFRPRADLVGGIEAVLDFLDGNALTRRSLDTINREEVHFVPSEWSLIDESPDGFRIRFIKGEKWLVGAGDVVALQPRESSKIHLCLVRRIANSAGRLELGLQLLSPQVSLIDITARDGSEQRAIFLHSLPAYGKFSALIAPPGLVTKDQQITFNSAGRALHRQIGKCIEANEGLEFFALDPLPH